MFKSDQELMLPQNENVELSDGCTAEIIGHCIESLKTSGQEIDIQQIMAEYQDFPPEFKEQLHFAITLEMLFSQVNEQASKQLTPDMLASAKQLMKLKVNEILLDEDDPNSLNT
jgi:hypothetical protein